MNFRNLMIISAVLALGFGIGFLALPDFLASLYGLDLTRAGTFVARLLGVELAGYGILAWFLRHVLELHVQRLVLLAFFITDASGFILSLLSQLSGLMNPTGWSMVAIYLLFSIAFGYLYVAKANAQTVS